MVTILIFGMTLRHAVGAAELEVSAGEAKTVRQLVEAHKDKIGGLLPFLDNREVLVTINKRIGTEDSPIKEGDTVKFAHQSRTSYDGTRDIPI